MWGRALYFTQSLNYVFHYSYKVNDSDGNSLVYTGPRKVIMAKVIIGENIALEPNN